MKNLIKKNIVEINIMKIKNIFPFLLVFAFILGACTERIDIHTDDAPPHLVIYGYITSDTTQHYVKITRSAGYFSTSRPEGISNAVVTIETEGEIILLEESLSEPGLYLTKPDVFGIEGKTYVLNVSLDFDNDGIMEQYTAESYLPFSIRLDSIGLQPSKALTDYIEVLVSGEISAEGKDYYSIHVYRNHHIVNDSLVGFQVYDDEYIDKTTIVETPLYYLNQDDDRSRIYDGDTISLRMDVITKEYADFIINAGTEIQGSIPFFSGPPANVETNIKSFVPDPKIPVVGFFTAYSGRTQSTIYRSKD
jgi:hypothetical protein